MDMFFIYRPKRFATEWRVSDNRGRPCLVCFHGYSDFADVCPWLKVLTTARARTHTHTHTHIHAHTHTHIQTHTHTHTHTHIQTHTHTHQNKSLAVIIQHLVSWVKQNMNWT